MTVLGMLTLPAAATAAGEPLAGNATLTLNPVVVEPGGAGVATVTMLATADFDDLTLTVPLSGLPAEFGVTAAAVGADICTVDANDVVCAGLSLRTGTARSLRLSISVGADAAAGASWSVGAVVLAPAGDPSDQVSRPGLLASTATMTYAMTVSVEALSDPAPSPGESTVLPVKVSNDGTAAADGYPLAVVLPDGTAHGTLPDECEQGSTDRIVKCAVSPPAGESVTVELPLAVDGDLAPGTVVTGGCVDEALGSGTPDFDYACGGADDLAVADFTVGPYAVDMALVFGGDTVPLTTGVLTAVRIHYSNDGSSAAGGLTFKVQPPAGVWMVGAELDSSAGAQRTTARWGAGVTPDWARPAAEAWQSGSTATESRWTTSGTVPAPATTPSPSSTPAPGTATARPGPAVAARSKSVPTPKAVAKTRTVVKTDADTEFACAVADEGNANDVTCTMPDAAAGSSNELWVGLVVGPDAVSGTGVMRVTAVAGEDGDATNNSVEVPLRITVTGTGGLPTTGGDAARLGLVSVVLVAFGVVLLAGGRERRLARAGGVHRRSQRSPRHARAKAGR